MKNPSCFQVTNSAITGIARVLLTSHDGIGRQRPEDLVDHARPC